VKGEDSPEVVGATGLLTLDKTPEQVLEELRTGTHTCKDRYALSYDKGSLPHLSTRTTPPPRLHSFHERQCDPSKSQAKSYIRGHTSMRSHCPATGTASMRFMNLKTGRSGSWKMSRPLRKNELISFPSPSTPVSGRPGTRDTNVSNGQSLSCAD
jgi:hypothetical protein